MELIAVQQNFTLKVDGGVSRSMLNAGNKKNIDSKSPLFLGGVPADVAKFAKSSWHLRNTTSFIGKSCPF